MSESKRLDPEEEAGSYVHRNDLTEISGRNFSLCEKMSPEQKECRVLPVALPTPKGNCTYSRSSMFCSSLYYSASTSVDGSHHPLAKMPFLPHPPKSEELKAGVDLSNSPLIASTCGSLPCQYEEQEGDPTNDFLDLSGVDVLNDCFHGQNCPSESLESNEQFELNILSEQLGIAMTDNEEYPTLEDIYIPSQDVNASTVEATCDQNNKNSRVCLVQVETKSSTGKSASVNKPRLRWTPELHERFLESVSKLGGAEKATPKGILKLMDVEGLTIYHVKSHLQKYRFAKYLPDKKEDEGSTSNKEEKTVAIINTKCDIKEKQNFQVMEALRIQIEVQKQLHEQLEVQRKLQLRIEEQARYLQKLLEEQQKASDSLASSRNSPSTEPQPMHQGCSQLSDSPFHEQLECQEIRSAASSSPREKNKMGDGDAETTSSGQKKPRLEN